MIFATIVQGFFIFYNDPRPKLIPERSPTVWLSHYVYWLNYLQYNLLAKKYFEHTCQYNYDGLIFLENGASKDPCSDTYCGQSAFTEPEVQGVANFLRNISNLKAFVDFHSYSQQWLSPLAYTQNVSKDFPLQVYVSLT